MNDEVLWPTWITNEIDGVSIGMPLLAFPSLVSLPEIVPPARGIRSGRDGSL